MSKYPRLDSIRRYKQPNTQHECEGCSEPADGRVCVQFTYMRGEDEFYYACQRHIDMARKTATFKQFLNDCEVKYQSNKEAS